MTKFYIAAIITVILCFAAVVGAQQAATKEECVVKSHEAAALITAKGLDEAIKQINDPTRPFRMERQLCFFDESGRQDVGSPHAAGIDKTSPLSAFN